MQVLFEQADRNKEGLPLGLIPGLRSQTVLTTYGFSSLNWLDKEACPPRSYSLAHPIVLKGTEVQLSLPIGRGLGGGHSPIAC